jgi:hypothetical protein
MFSVGKDFPMRWFDQLKRRFDSEAGLPALAERIAEQCFEVVWQRVQGQLLGFDPSEARGYIRSRSSQLIRIHVRAAADHAKMTTTQRTRLYTLTADTTIQRIQSHASAIASMPQRRVA